jgi:hypothetical protein
VPFNPDRLTQGLDARFASLLAAEPDPSRQLATTGRLGDSGATPTTVLPSAEEVKARLREMINGFFLAGARCSTRYCFKIAHAGCSMRLGGGATAMCSLWLVHRVSRLALPFVIAAMSPLALALGQTTAPGSPIVSDVPVAGGTERLLFLGGQGARALLVLLPGSDGIIGLDPGGAVHQLGSNFLVRTMGQ